MQRICHKIAVTLLILIGVAGCAGHARQVQSKTPNPFPEQVAESFDWVVRDPHVRKLLNASRPNIYVPGDALEVALLSALATADNRIDLDQIWDGLWASQPQIKTLLERPQSREGHENALALIYYLLSAVEGGTWQRSAAQRLYIETMHALQPEQLSGYALHFFCYALILNNYLEAAAPFLARLGQFKSPVHHAADLETAIAAAMDRDAHVLARQYWARHRALTDRAGLAHLGVPSETMNNAVRRQSLRYGPVTMPVTIVVQVIRAGNNDSFIDPRLSGIRKELQATLKFKSYRQIREQDFNLAVGQPAEMQLDDTIVMRLVLEHVGPRNATIGVVIVEEKRVILKTRIESVDFGTSLIGGPATAGGMLMVRLKTLLHVRS